MNKLLVLAILATGFFGVSSDARAEDEHKIEATVYRIDMNLRLYEVCGKITGPSADGITVEIVPDEGTKQQGNYNTFANSSGQFCHVVRIIGNRLNIRLPSVDKAAEFKL
jgi:hypothetical protein